ncbi:hypothetical protein H0O00_00240 [Candidatus Micrarchaeota archaeon]|nr:hypothetical protein [Candidatus Micrarchaeota archaeon]
MSDFMVLQPAFIDGRPGYIPPISVYWPEPAKPNINRFDSGGFDTDPAHACESVSRMIIEIMNWGQVDILLPGETPATQGRKYMNYLEAQDAVAKLIAGKESSHQYLSYEAAKLLGTNPLIQRYTLHLIIGSMAEDYVFAPGEKLEDLIRKEPRVPRRRTGMPDWLDYDDVPSITTGIFELASNLLGDLNSPSHSHFLQVLSDGTSRGLEILNGDLKFKSAKDRIMQYWDLAARYYAEGDMPRAFCALGHMMHLVQDIHMPTHVHNDPHGPGIAGGLDSLEPWYTLADYPHIARKADSPNIRIWSSKGIARPKLDTSWTKGNVGQKLGAFIDKIAINTQRYRSVDHMGTVKDQKKTGKLSPKECYDQAEYLVPLAIYKSAWLVSEFLDYHKRVYGIG